jgi:DNA-binding transcriptional ArsR family regulator
MQLTTPTSRTNFKPEAQQCGEGLGSSAELERAWVERREALETKEEFEKNRSNYDPELLAIFEAKVEKTIRDTEYLVEKEREYVRLKAEEVKNQQKPLSFKAADPDKLRKIRSIEKLLESSYNALHGIKPKRRRRNYVEKKAKNTKAQAAAPPCPFEFVDRIVPLFVKEDAEKDVTSLKADEIYLHCDEAQYFLRVLGLAAYRVFLAVRFSGGRFKRRSPKFLERFGLTQKDVSTHLPRLLKAGLVVKNRKTWVSSISVDSFVAYFGNPRQGSVRKVAVPISILADLRKFRTYIYACGITKTVCHFEYVQRRKQLDNSTAPNVVRNPASGDSYAVSTSTVRALRKASPPVKKNKALHVAYVANSIVAAETECSRSTASAQKSRAQEMGLLTQRREFEVIRPCFTYQDLINKKKTLIGLAHHIVTTGEMPGVVISMTSNADYETVESLKKDKDGALAYCKLDKFKPELPIKHVKLSELGREYADYKEKYKGFKYLIVQDRQSLIVTSMKVKKQRMKFTQDERDARRIRSGRM